MEKFDPIKIIALLLPIAVFYIAFDAGGHNALPKLGISVIMMIFAIGVLLGKTHTGLPGKWPPLLFTGFLGWSLLTLFWSLSPAKTLNEAVYLSGIFSAYIVGNNMRDKQSAMKILTGASLLITLIGFYFFLMPRFGLIEKSHDMQNYFFATFYWKNPAAAFISLFLPIVLYFVMSSTKKIETVLWTAALVTMGSAFLLTRSRGAILSLGIAFVATFVLLLFNKDTLSGILDMLKRRWMALTTGLVLIIIIFFLLVPHDSKRQVLEGPSAQTAVVQERSSFERKAMIELGLNMLTDRPLGTGLGAFIDAYPQYLKSSFYLSSHLHNQYLQYAVETGFPGLLLFLFLMLSIVLAIRRKGESLPILIGFVGFCLHLLLDFHWTFAGVAMPAFLLAGMASTERKFEKLSLKFGISAFLILLLAVGTLSSLSILFHDNASTEDGTYGKWMERSVKVFPASAENRYYLSQYLRATGDMDRAEKQLEKAIQLEPESSSLHAALAHIMFEMGNTDRGLEYMQRAIELAPYSSPGNYRLIGDMLLSRGQQEQAFEVFTKVTERFSSETDEDYTSKIYAHRYHVGYAHRRLAELLLEKSDTLQAETHLGKAVRLEQPRRNDALAAKIGISTFSPEFVAVDYVKKALENAGVETDYIGISDVQYDLFSGQAMVTVFYIVKGATEIHSFPLVLQGGEWQMAG